MRPGRCTARSDQEDCTGGICSRYCIILKYNIFVRAVFLTKDSPLFCNRTIRIQNRKINSISTKLFHVSMKVLHSTCIIFAKTCMIWRKSTNTETSLQCLFANYQ
ncbi:hypothetical protein DWW88_22515 [Bacteroides cellulosilyticus]|nr:hypothetical protein DWW88_22515 [Bacteroides cellulosilyticus]